jgi:leucyl-tRNA synthetase
LFGGTEKMSKSKNNVVEPRDIIGKFGADTARTFAMFAGPPDQSAAWSNSGAEGTFRFLRRLWNFCQERQNRVAAASDAAVIDGSAAVKSLRREIHLNLKQADFDYGRMQYNTVVSAVMKMLNALEDARLADTPAENAALREGLGILLRTLYPIAPYITQALWVELGYARTLGPLLDAAWPQADEAALRQDELDLVVQVNGKLRGQIRVPAGADKEAVEAAALADANVQKFLGGQPVKRLIVVPGKLVNVVL